VKTVRASRRAVGVLVLAGAAVLAVSCASSSSEPKSVAPPIATGGDTAGLNALVGRWEGTYTNPTNKRTGTIVLEFFSGGKEAHGDILMIPPGSKQAVPSPEETLRTMPRVLEINFIEAGTAGKITGNIGPYEEPDTHCSARTTFVGTVKGGSIEGTFRTECFSETSAAAVSDTNGTWSVTRKK
jgi:hypothetical protein